MNKDVELATKFLKVSYPVLRVKIDDQGMICNKGNFKRVIMINSWTIYKLSDTTQRYKAMNLLTKILSRVFYFDNEVSLPIIKKHLHII
jgi:hypothetical protein